MQEGTTTQWPGDPAAAWTSTASSTLPLLDRSRDVPRPESVDDVARCEHPDLLGRTELVHAPILWALLPLSALGNLVWVLITGPRDGDGDATVTTVPPEKKLQRIRRRFRRRSNAQHEERRP